MAQSERQKYSTENKSTLLEPIFIVDMITGTLAFTLFDNGLHGWPTRKKKWSQARYVVILPTPIKGYSFKPHHNATYSRNLRDGISFQHRE